MIYKYILIITLLVNFLQGNANKEIKDISALVAPHLYELNNDSLENILENYLKDNQNIKYLILYDTLVNKKYLSYYKNKEKVIKNSFNPKQLNFNCEKVSIDIRYKNEKIGSLEICKENDNALNLTKEEKQWLEKNKVIKVHNEYDWAPFNFNERKTAKGYSIDYIKLLAQSLGLELEFVTGTWNESLQKAYNKKIDVMLNIAKTKQRQKYLSYVGIYARNITSILTKKNRDDISNIDSLLGKKVSVVEGFIYEKFLEENYPKIKIIKYKNTLDSIKAVIYDEVDATLGKTANLNYIMNENVIKGLKYTADVKANDPEMENLYIAVRNDEPTLHSLLKKAMQKVSIEEMDKLKLKWFNQKRRVQFTKEEYKWLDKKRVIRYSEVNWKPLAIIEKNSMTGIIGDYLNIVAEATGIEFEFVPSNSWPEVLEKFKNKEIDLVPGIGDTKEETSLGAVSKKYATFPMVIVSNESINYIDSLDDIKNKVLSIPKFYTSYNYIKEIYPNIKIIETENIFDALLNVSNKDADIFLGHLAPTIYYMTKIGKDNLKIVGNSGVNFKHHFLINPELTEFLSITNKVFDSLTQKERDKIYNGWIDVKVKQNLGFSLKKILSYLLPLLFIILLIILIIIYWNRKLKILVDKKTADIFSKKQELQSLVDSFDRNVIFVQTDLNGIITHPSKAFCEISKYSESELKGQGSNIVRHPDSDEKLFKELWQTIKAQKRWSGEIKNMAKDGTTYWLYSKIEPAYNKSLEFIGFKAISQDITNRKIVESLSKNLEKKVEERTFDLQKAKSEIELMHQNTKDSIEYASLIQSSLIPSNDLFKKHFSDSFQLWEPKDIVGGDIYLFEELNDNECILMLIDCTGHGVSGAFVTMLVKAIERQIIAFIKNNNEKVSPAKILSIFNKSMKHLLKQETADSISNVGFDGSIIYYNKKEKIIKFSGAELPLIFTYNKKVNIIKGNRHSVGYKKSQASYTFDEHEVEVQKGMTFYLASDGYWDQNGGKKGFPFGKRSFLKLLEKYSLYPLSKQKELLTNDLFLYQNKNERNDDITIIGFKI